MSLFTRTSNDFIGAQIVDVFPKRRAAHWLLILLDQRSTEMMNINLQLPESLHKRVREQAELDQVSINQWITVAVAEKMAALLTEDYLPGRAQRANRIRFEAVMAKIPDVEPAADDRLD